MKKKYFAVIPGSFCPPTTGHLSIVKEASEIFDKVNIVCSRNRYKKDYWFSQEECAAMWQSMDLPKNANVYTFGKIKKMFSLPFKDFIVIRGIRDIKNMHEEKRSLLISLEEFGVDKFFFIFGKEKHKDISSAKLRYMAEYMDLIGMKEKTSPLVISYLLEKALNIKKLFIVSGKTGSGKTRIINELSKKHPVEYIDVDELVRELHPIVKEHFNADDVLSLVKSRPDEVADFLEIPLIEKIQEKLINLKKSGRLDKDTILMIECAYGLKYKIFKYIGGRILYIDSSELKKRIIERKTPQHMEFIDKIPGLEKSKKICSSNKLSLIVFNNDEEIEEGKAEELYLKLKNQ